MRGERREERETFIYLFKEKIYISLSNYYSIDNVLLKFLIVTMFFSNYKNIVNVLPMKKLPSVKQILKHLKKT
jgi:hypothetical protein